MTASTADDGLLRYRIDWLQMLEPPNADPAPCPSGERAELVAAVDFPVWYFFAMYDAVGDGYAWEDMHLADPIDVENFIGSADTRMHTLIRHGWPQGFFVLDFRTGGVCDIAYFGLVKQAIGKGFGGWLLEPGRGQWMGDAGCAETHCEHLHTGSSARFSALQGTRVRIDQEREPHTSAPPSRRMTESKGHAMLNSLAPQPPDKIIKLMQEFKDDPREKKIDLGVGVYRDRSGATPIMRAVKRAEKSLWEAEQTKSYTGIAGDPGFQERHDCPDAGRKRPRGPHRFGAHARRNRRRAPGPRTDQAGGA